MSDTLRPKITLPAFWKENAFIGRCGRPCIRFVADGAVFFFDEKLGKKVIQAMIAEFLNGLTNIGYSDINAEIAWQLCLATAFKNGQLQGGGPLDPFEQDELFQAAY